MDDNYILLYGDKKIEDNILITNMFENNINISLGWIEVDYINNIRIIESVIKEKNIKQIIFMGLEIGWDKLIKYIKKEYCSVKVKVICNTLDSLLYYEYERNNFFRLLELSSQGLIDDIGFLRKGQYETYKKLGYNCSWLKEYYNLASSTKEHKINNKINIGIYPLNYTWDKNIFNQLCIGKFVENSIINYNLLDDRMKNFLDTMKIKSCETKISEICEETIIKELMKNDINISCSFTEYLHTIFFISMELEIPCIIGNTSDLFEKDDELKQYIVTNSEDNAIINAEKILNCIQNKNKIIELYKKWKVKYSVEAEKSKNEFLKR